ncbi:Heat shock protein 30 [Venustampulla echinocandica]|uniref:Heat shock protein 30 n=1 Tax=Venustampulla echinocandica TaxID=2656787 RepID=A0A370TTU6_9HELO|nr:Heat shock protein 30 [Venustampulla echinocandica]RDL38945.1 Heat shock protein 30 [Venustampulla echinocandica]
MSVLFPRTNHALVANPPVGDTHLTTSSSDWLWAVTACYCVGVLIVAGWAYVARAGEKVFHYLFTISLLVGSIAYFAAASDLGNVPIRVSNDNSRYPGTRQISYAKYIFWILGWTPLVIALGLISGVSWATIIYNVALMWTWIASWLSGALVASHYKWGFYVFGIFAYLLLGVSLLHTGSITARRIEVSGQYLGVTGWVVFVWMLYAIAWGLDDGGNRISVSDGWIFWGILDVALVPLTSLAILFLATRWDYRNLNLYFTQYGRVAQGGTYPEREKAHPVAPADTAAADTTAPVAATEV